MKNRSNLIKIKTKLLSAIMSILIVGIIFGRIATQAQTINFDVAGSFVGAINYSGPGAAPDTNSYWNPIAGTAQNYSYTGGTTSGGLLSDGITASPITLTLPSTTAYNSGGQGAQGTPAGLESPFILEGNGTNTVIMGTLNNVPSGTYNLYLYGKNGPDDNRGVKFSASTSLKVASTMSTLNTYSSPTNYIKGDDYVLYKNLVVGTDGTITFTFTANTAALASDGNPADIGDYSGANQEADFNGLQLEFVSTSTNLPPDTLNLNEIYPNGTNLFQPSGILSFVASSVDGIDPANVTVQLTGTNVNGKTFTSQILTSGKGLAIAVNSTNLNVSTPLVNNFFYQASIQVIDLDGYETNYTYVFDTVDTVSAYTFEAEDFNFGGGQFLDNPSPDAYAGSSRNAIQGTDVNDPDNASEMQAYGRSGLETQVAADKPRNEFSGFIDYDVGANNSGNWADYTRTFPKGPYVIYMRASSPTGGMDSATLSEDVGGTLTALGTFSVPATNNLQEYAWVPLLDANGNPVVFVGDGETAKTLHVAVDGGGYNANFYMLASVNTNFVNITNIYPDGTVQFQSTNAFSFTVNASDEVSATNILVSVSSTNLLGQSFVTNLSGSSLSIMTFGNSQIVSFTLNSNTVYNLSIQVTDVSGITTKTNVFFDTVSPSHIFEAEDFDYNGGLWADPFVDGNVDEFAGAPAIINIDDYDALVASGGVEQSDTYGRGGLDTEPCGDKPRLNYLNADGAQDYDVGDATIGNWGNYTRIYPAGTYNIYMRAATPNASIADAAGISIITAGQGTTNQIATNVLGTFSVPTTGNYQTYNWVPLTHDGGQLAQVTFDGSSAETLRVTTDTAGYNANYYMLIPADTTLPVISGTFPNGQYQFQNSGSFSFNAESSAGFNDTGISVLITGTNLVGQGFTTNYTSANGLIFSGSSTNLNVSLPLSGNMVYTAVITVTTENNKTTTSTISFDTIVPTFVFEAEDFNYNGGQYVNSPETNAYLDLPAIIGIDAEATNYNASGQMDYRTNVLNVEVTGDTPRLPYVNTGLSDYDVGNNGTGNWADYSRTFPAGIYNIYMRGANGQNLLQPNAAGMALVTGGATTTNQALVSLGTFSVPGTNGAWQVYSDVPLIDSDGNYAEFVSSGSQQTLRATTDNGNYNVNYYFLLPADTTLPINPPNLKASVIGTNLSVSFLSRTNTTYQLLFKTNLTDSNWMPVGSVVSGNSLIESFTNSINGSSGFYRLQTLNQ